MFLVIDPFISFPDAAYGVAEMIQTVLFARYMLLHIDQKQAGRELLRVVFLLALPTRVL